ncbi:uncharacterized protein BXZ73DRAFT_25481, partial [Epithele typhae]|uniref:uncharacterized protein n=1 Tax=Epithele typhae TaxID=378194 RepID=UPI0020078CF8
ADAWLSKYERSDGGLRAWLDAALLPGGAMLYGDPDIENNNKAKEFMQSSFVLATMEHHASWTKGALRPRREDRPYPVGALALALAAIERAFRYHSLQSPNGKGTAMPAFSKVKAGSLTTKWMRTAVADLLEMSESFDRLVEAADELAGV